MGKITGSTEKEVNNLNLNMLTSLLIIPILGVLALSPMQDESAADRSRMKQIALFVTVFNFLVSLLL